MIIIVETVHSGQGLCAERLKWYTWHPHVKHNANHGVMKGTERMREGGRERERQSACPGDRQRVQCGRELGDIGGRKFGLIKGGVYSMTEPVLWIFLYHNA